MIKSKIDIEVLVTWALRDQGLGWVVAGNGGWEMELAKYGTRIDKSVSWGGLPAPGVGLNDSGDALTVKAAIDRLPPDAAALVVTYGRIGLRPDWGAEGYGRPLQLTNKRGQPQWEYRDPQNWRDKIGPKLDWRAYENHVAAINFERAAWVLWREALVTLCAALHTLAGYEVTGPSAPAEPWAGMADDGPVGVPYAGSLAERRAYAGNRVIRTVPTDTGIPSKPILRPEPRKTGADGAEVRREKQAS